MIHAPLIARLAASLFAGIHGTVHAAGDAAPAVGVHVEVDGAARCLTDSAGRYQVTGLAGGEHRVRFVSASYELRELTVFLVDSTTLSLDVELTPRPVLLQPISVVARGGGDSTGPGAAGTSAWRESGDYRLGPGWQAGQPAGGVDIQDALSRAPGVATRGDNTTSLSIHGAPGSENRILIDGIPIYGAVHFAGASSAVNPDAIAAMDLHTGVSSARFGDALSGVVELETGEGFGGGQVSGDLSSADVRSLVRAPLGGGGVLFSARSSFRDLLTDGAGLGTTNGYQDFLAATRTVIGSGTLRLVGFASSSRLAWGADDHSAASVTAPATAPAAGDAADWQSTALGVTWTDPIRSNVEWHAASWWSANAASVNTLAADQSMHLAGGIGELGFSTDLSERFRSSTVALGGEVTVPHTSYDAATTFANAAATMTDVALEATPVVGAVYGEWAWHGSSLVDFRAGLRANADFQQSVSLDPRVLVNIHPDHDTRFELGFGRTHQFAQSMLNEDNVMSAIIGPALLTNAANGLPPASADQWIASVVHQLDAGVTVALDGYARRWSNVLAPAVTTSGFFVSGIPDYGNGHAAGLDASLSIEHDRVTAHATAGIASSVQDAAGTSYSSSYDRPWSFSGDVSYRLPARTTVQLRWNTGAGAPATALLSGIEWHPYQPATGTGEVEGIATNLTGAINTLRLPGPFRVDLGVRREWGMGAAGRSSGFTTAVRLENLFDRADPVALTARPDGTVQFLRGTPRGLVLEVGWAH